MSDPGKNDSVSVVKKALLAIEQLQQRILELEKERIEPIAIVGMGCRFPGGSNTPGEYWDFLLKGLDAVSEIPAGRWDKDAFYDADMDAPGKICTDKAAFIRDVDQFDADFFKISPKEANCLDPQQRLLLEVSWEALENASIIPSSLAASRTGVFIGIGQNDYAQLALSENYLENVNPYSGTGNGMCFAAGRISYSLGLNGPCIALDTACSSSLVAIHLACQSLRLKECETALAGGVQLVLTPPVSVFLSRAHALSPSGSCKTFDEAADGYARGEGCGIVVLKRLSDAIKDENLILGVIKGSAVNHDGKSSGLTVPSGLAQEKLIHEALRNAGMAAESIDLVEAHGTGTPLGDPIEMEALGNVLGKGHSKENPLYISSVKTNIGHLEAAAGIAGLIKTILSIRHQSIPAHLNFHKQSPHIPWDKLPFKVPVSLTPWMTTEKKRAAGVSSFGFSGTNAHVIVEEWENPVPVDKDPRPLFLLTLSARSQSSLQLIADRYASFLGSEGPDAIADAVKSDPIAAVCYASHIGRSHFEHRLAVTGSSSTEIREKLTSYSSGDISAVYSSLPGGRPPRVAFVFTKEWGAFRGMYKELFETQPVFRRVLSECADMLSAVISPGGVNDIDALDKLSIDEPAYREPWIFSIGFSLYKLWDSWGISGYVFPGNPAGEYIAAVEAGALSLKDALHHVLHRDRLIQELPASDKKASPITDPPEPADFDVQLEIGPGSMIWRTLLASLGELYVKGIMVDWKGFEKGYPNHKVSLPNYAFDRKRYWIDLPSKAAKNEFIAASHASAASGTPREEFIYDLQWEMKSPALSVPAAAVKDDWFIFSEDRSGGERLQKILVRAGHRVHFIDLTDQDGYSFATMNLPDKANCKTAFLGRSYKGGEGDSLDFFHTGKRQYHILLQLVKDLIAARSTIPLWIITTEAIRTIQDDGVNGFDQAPFWGIGKALCLENPALFGGLIDMEANPSESTETSSESTEAKSTEDAIVNAIYGNTLPDNKSENFISIRKGQQYVLRLIPGHHPIPVQKTIQSDKAYLITGGTGALGLALADWLAAQGAKKIILCSRSGVDSPDAATAIGLLEKTGVKIQVVKVDISREEEVKKLLDQFRTDPTSPGGLFHAAGITGYDELKDMAIPDFDKLLQPKMEGSWFLHKHSQDIKLDFFVCFSSIASVWGSKGQAHYSAANHFIDSLCALRGQQGLPALSINWGPWDGHGMSKPEIRAILGKMGIAALSPKNALATLGLLLGTNSIHQAVVASMNWKVFKEIYGAKRNSALFDKIILKDDIKKEGAVAEKGAAALSAIPALERKRAIVGIIQSEAAKILGFEKGRLPDADKGFFDMGMDSLMAIELKARLQTQFSIDLPSTLAFDFPTINDVASFLETRMSLPGEAIEVRSPHMDEVLSMGGGRITREELEDSNKDELALLLARELELSKREEY